MKKILVVKKTGCESVKVYKLHEQAGCAPAYYQVGDSCYGRPNPAIGVEKMEKMVNSALGRVVFAE